MGVFDFVRDVGAKVGIGKSSDEREAEAAAAEHKAAAVERGKKWAAARALNQKRQADKEAKDAVAAAATAKKQAAFKARKAERIKAAAARRFEEHKQSKELESYVRALGLDDEGDVDIRFDDGVAYIEGLVPDQETREKIILAVGNAEGVGRVNEEIEVAAQEEEAVMHTVASGDTLWAIAQSVYGDGNRYPEIFEANQPMLTDPDLIYPGQVLRCPK
jgi:nucleoid-associated protein YgaU